ncbi:MAG: dockerin type I repeat-containing protein [Candidatus Zixiibacteriota bacterium]
MGTPKFRTIFWTIVFALIAVLAFGQVPQTVNYQGNLVDDVGDPITATVPMTFNIYDTPTAGTLIWGEEHLLVDVVDGGFSVILGSTNPLINEVFLSSERWLEVVVNGQPMAPRVKFTSVPYSQRVATIEGAVGGTVTGSFQVLPERKDGFPDEAKHSGTPIVEIGTGFTVNTNGLPGSLHLLDGTAMPVIDLDGQSASIGINTTNIQANLDVEGDIYTLGGDGDIDLNGITNVMDLSIYIGYLYLGGTLTHEQYANGDIDGDGRINSDDIAMVIRMVYLIESKAQAMRTIHASYGASPDSNYPDAFTVRGSIGIGTYNPGEKLHVLWDPNVDAELGRGTSNTNITYMALRNANGTKCYIYPDPTGNTIIVSTTKP